MEDFRIEKKYLGNAFSLQMLDLQEKVTICVEPASLMEVADPEVISVIGHSDTAAVVSDILGCNVACNRASVKLAKGDTLYVAQVTGGRLPEGATTLPEGMTLTFVKVTLA